MLRVARDGGVVIWTVDRPETKNALDHATLASIGQAARSAAMDASVRVAVLEGAGDMFVSGGDLRELRDRNTPEDGARLSDLGWETCRALVEAPFPIIAALSGPAIGGGAELAVACDMRVCDPSASFAFRQVRMGVTCAWGTVPRLLSMVGAGTTARLLYTGQAVSAHEARTLGLADEVTDSARVTALAWAQDIAQGSPRAVAEMKRLVRQAGAALAEARDLERALFVQTWSGADHREAVDAYFSRRPPRWNAR